MNATGGLEIVNSAYSDTIFYLADNGNLSELGTVNGATLEDTGWIAVSSLTNSFSSLTGVAYRKINNVVYLRGNLTGGTANTGALTLPVGYRPSIDTVVPVQQYGTPNVTYVTVGTDGVVVPNSTSGWLSSIIFPIG
jgi:PPE-repeat protein